MKEIKDNSSGDLLLIKTSSLLKDDCLENIILTLQRAEKNRDEKLKRIFGKANSLYASIKRQQEQMKDVEQLKSSDLILLHQRLKNMEHKIKQMQSSLKIKITKLFQEEQTLSFGLEQMNDEMQVEQIIDFPIITEGQMPCTMSENEVTIDWKKASEERSNKKIIQQLLQEIQCFKQEAKKLNGLTNV